MSEAADLCNGINEMPNPSQSVPHANTATQQRLLASICKEVDVITSAGHIGCSDTNFSDNLFSSIDIDLKIKLPRLPIYCKT